MTKKATGIDGDLMEFIQAHMPWPFSDVSRYDAEGLETARDISRRIGPLLMAEFDQIIVTARDCKRRTYPKPRPLSTDQKVCTAEHPMPPGDPKWRWTHPDAEDVGEEYNGLSGGGDYDIYECPHCKRRLYVELPD